MHESASGNGNGQSRALVRTCPAREQPWQELSKQQGQRYYVNGLGAVLCFCPLSQPLKSPHRHSENSLSAFTAFLLVHLTLSEERPPLTLESGWPLNSVCGDKASLWRAKGEGRLSPSPTPPAQQLQPWPGVQGSFLLQLPSKALQQLWA